MARITPPWGGFTRITVGGQYGNHLFALDWNGDVWEYHCINNDKGYWQRLPDQRDFKPDG